jgi:ankyrin repeat protein
MQDNMRFMRRLVKIGVSINTVDEDGRIPLHYVCKNGNVEAALYLIELGSNTAIKDKKGFTPLELALKHKHTDMTLIF